MENKMVFGRWEATALIINLLCTQIILGFPRLMVETAGTAAWILVIYISVLAFLSFYIIQKLYAPFEGKDLLDIGEHMGGNVGRILVGSIIVIYFTALVAIVMRQFSEYMIIIALVNTPISFITMFFITGIAAGAYMGLEAIVRLTAIALPLIIAAFFFITVAIAPYYDFTNIFPIWGLGLEKIFISGSLKISTFSALSVLFLLPPFIKKHDHFKKAGYIAIGVTSIFFLWSTLAVLFVFPYPTTLEHYLPIYQISRLINLGRFFQRVESIFVLTWAITALLYLSTIFFFMVFVFKKTFRLDYYRPLIIPFAILIFNLSLFPPNLISAAEIEESYFKNYDWIITFVLPIILLFIARNIKRKQRGNSQNV